MSLLVSDYKILLNITTMGHFRERLYRLQKYYNILTEKINICVCDESVDFNITVKCNANKVLYDTIIRDEHLEAIEVYCHDLPCKYINYANIECDKIILYNILTCEYEFLVPSKYGDNIKQFITDNSYNSKSNLTLEQQNYLSKVKQSRIVKSFIDEFNNNENISKLKNIKFSSSDCSKKTHEMLQDANDNLSNAIDEINDNAEFDKDFNAGRFDDIEVSIVNLNNKLEIELMNINLELSSFKTKPTTKYNVITPENIVDQSVLYHKEAKMTTCDIIETIKQMLISSRYTLSDDFKNKKLDFKNVQFNFKVQVSPDSISRDDIFNEVFHIDNEISLI